MPQTKKESRFLQYLYSAKLAMQPAAGPCGCDLLPCHTVRQLIPSTAITVSPSPKQRCPHRALPRPCAQSESSSITMTSGSGALACRTARACCAVPRGWAWPGRACLSWTRAAGAGGGCGTMGRASGLASTMPGLAVELQSLDSAQATWAAAVLLLPPLPTLPIQGDAWLVCSTVGCRGAAGGRCRARPSGMLQAYAGACAPVPNSWGWGG